MIRNFNEFCTKYRLVDYTLHHPTGGYQLAITSNKARKLVRPDHQLIYRNSGSRSHNKRLTGLFRVGVDLYRGDIIIGGYKRYFYIRFDRSNNSATISKRR